VVSIPKIGSSGSLWAGVEASLVTVDGEENGNEAGEVVFRAGTVVGIFAVT